MWLRWLALCVTALLCGHAYAASATGNRVLVLAEESALYKKWIDTLGKRGWNVDVQDVAGQASDHELYAHGERNYDHVAILAPSMKEFPATMTPQHLVTFLQDGGNMLVALNSQLSETWRAFAREFDLEFAQRETMLVDHFGYDKRIDTGNHAAVKLCGASFLTRGGPRNLPVFKDETRAECKATPFVYRGIAHWVGPNPLTFSAIAPPLSAYETDVPRVSGSPGHWTAQGIDAIEPLYEARAPLVGADAHSPGATASLASALQLRDNSARATFVGSTEVFGALYTSDVQRKVIDDLVSWTFQEHGVISVERTAHERVAMDESDVRPEYEEEPGAVHMYRIKDTVKFTIDLSAFDREWKAAPRDLDLQVSFVMLDAYETEPLVATATIPGERPVTRYEANLVLPDRHGVFAFKVNWKRHGLSYVVTSDSVPVRPFNHDEYPRMLSSSWPYVAGAFSTMAAFVAFVCLWFNMPSPKGKTA